MAKLLVWTVVAFSWVAGDVMAQTSADALIADSRQLLKELVAIDTSEPNGSTTPAAERIRAFLLAAGYPADDVVVAGADSKRGNLVARLRGRGTARPVLFLAHLDVVPALREDWTTDPYELVEKDGYYYGRGTTDDKQFCAIFTAVFARLKREGFVPDRDLILALTAGEETGPDAATNGVIWLLANRRPLIDAAYVINGDAAGGGIDPQGRYLGFGVQAAEKLYADFTLEATHEGGHSSRVVPDNPIYSVARALTRIEALKLPFKVNDITRGFFGFLATRESGTRAADLRAIAARTPDDAAMTRLAEADPSLNAQLRTTCVATQTSAGHAPNALPQRARANVNCRIFPGETPAEVQAALVQAIGDPKVSVTHTSGLSSSPQPRIDAAVLGLITKAAEATWPGVPVVPVLEVGATDGLFLRQAGYDVYGLNHFQRDEDARAHGKDERIGIRQFDEAARFSYTLATLVAR
jgi:acetylornithine deacetylase/succinyl-diaminopimelate desuccinylase-like protein